MNNIIKTGVITLAFIMPVSAQYALAADNIAVPEGFEDIFNASQDGIYDVVYNDQSVGSFAIEYTQTTVTLSSPTLIANQITAIDMPALTISKQELIKRLSVPLRRVKKDGFASDDIVIGMDESEAALRLIFPSSLFKSGAIKGKRVFIPHRAQMGFVHNHNVNFLSDSYGDSLSIASTDILNLTGNAYVKSQWSYADEIDFNIDEAALYLESKNVRFKAGRQQLSDNLNDSTPSMSWSFFTPLSFDGVSLGYMTDNYLEQPTGAASPVSVYLPQAGTVEVYRRGRLIDVQQFPAGLQYLNTRTWPSGGYEVELISKLTNGSKQRKVQPFFKRSGAFRSGDVEFLMQMGRYDRHQGELNVRSGRDKNSEQNSDWFHQLVDNNFASGALAYTTSSAFSLGVGMLMDDNDMYANTSLEIPMNTWLIERVNMDGYYGRDGSRGFQVGAMKNYHLLGLNATYRDSRFRGAEDNFHRFSIVPSYDYKSLQFGTNTLLPWNIGLGINYGLNTYFQEYGHRSPSKFTSWDIDLNRDFSLTDTINLRVDLGYHRGMNEFVSRYATESEQEDQIYAQFSLGFHERSYNHYQSLYLRSRTNSSNNGNDSNSYSGDYTLNLDNPDFDRGGKYIVNASVGHSADGQNSEGASVVADNRFGYTSAGFSQALGGNHYNQFYVAQRGGFALGDGSLAFGTMDDSSALILDARELPKDQYFEVRNRSVESTIIKGGDITTMAISPYQKIDPKAEQLFTGKTDAFYNLMTKATSTWIMPGQAYHVTLSATKNQTVTGKLLLGGKPLAKATVVGANSRSDEDGIFVGDFTLKTSEQLKSLNVKKNGQHYVCPVEGENVKMTQGIMQIREVNCEVQ